MAVSEEKLSELEEALAELGKDDDEVSAVLRRFEGGQRADLAAVDRELDALGDGASLAPIVSDPSTVETRASEIPVIAEDQWASDETEVEIIDPDDIVFLVDEDDLEELERAADAVPGLTVPPPLPGESKAQDVDDDEEDEGFFKKLFGSRRSSHRP